MIHHTNLTTAVPPEQRFVRVDNHPIWAYGFWDDRWCTIYPATSESFLYPRLRIISPYEPGVIPRKPISIGVEEVVWMADSPGPDVSEPYSYFYDMYGIRHEVK